jgi:hypothetical protein
MKACKEYTRDFLAYLGGQLEKTREQELAKHLEYCSACREELEKTSAVLSMASSFRHELKQVMETVDWGHLSEKITEKAWEKSKRSSQKPVRFWLNLWRSQPLAAGLIIGLILGGLLTYSLFWSEKPEQRLNRETAKLTLLSDLIDRIDLAMARRQTINYLERSQYLLLEILQTEHPASDLSLMDRERIKQLLTDKKYLNNQLDDFRLLKARAICDQIELLFLELSQLSPELTAYELERVRQMVEEKQLLLKINLVKKELEQSEV